MNRHALLAIAVVVLVPSASSCSSSSKDAVPGANNSVGADVASTAAETGAAGTDAGQASTDSGLGSCQVNITGDVNTAWTSPGGYSAIGYGPWIPATPGVTTPMPLDESFFILNCTGPGDSTVSFGAAAEARIPMQPATYPILPPDNALGANDPAQPIAALFSLDGTDTNWGASAPGTFIITEFDSAHIAGNFSIPVTDLLADITGTSKGNAMITGEFNYANPN